LRNVVGTVAGRSPAILVGAHYDVEAAPRGFVGANDGAAGTAAVVTLARRFARAPRPAGERRRRRVALPPTDAGVHIINDHTPFSERGVPAIDVIDFDYPQRDSLADNLTAVCARSLDAVGEAVYGLIARLR